MLGLLSQHIRGSAITILSFRVSHLLYGLHWIRHPLFVLKPEQLLIQADHLVLTGGSRCLHLGQTSLHPVILFFDLIELSPQVVVLVGYFLNLDARFNCPGPLRGCMYYLV